MVTSCGQRVRHTRAYKSPREKHSVASRLGRNEEGMTKSTSKHRARAVAPCFTLSREEQKELCSRRIGLHSRMKVRRTSRPWKLLRSLSPSLFLSHSLNIFLCPTVEIRPQLALDQRCATKDHEPAVAAHRHHKIRQDAGELNCGQHSTYRRNSPSRPAHRRGTCGV